MSPLAGAFKLKIIIALIVLWQLFCGGPAVLVSSANETDAIFGDLKVAQNLSLTVGVLRGGKEDFLRYEELSLPSLNPEIELGGQVGFKLELPPHARLKLMVSTGEKAATSFGIGYGNWDLEYGPQTADFKKAGLAYARNIEGLRLRYLSLQSSFDLEALAAKTSSRFAEFTFKGDDSFGPFFLGQKDIVGESEEVLLNGKQLKRGAGPGDGDYYLDYKGGFLYFNRVVLAHETIQVLFEHTVDDPGLASVFRGGMASFQFGCRRANIFVLQDRIPLDEGSILRDSGSSLHAYGAYLKSTWDKGGSLENTLLISDLDRYQVGSEVVQERLTMKEQDYEYTLKHTPILYLSERVVLADESEELVRNLDYVLDYHSGELVLMYAPAADSQLDVEYTCLLPNEIEEMGSLRGARSLNRFQYADNTWSTNTWLEGTFGEFVNVRTQKPPSQRFAAGTSSEYRLDEKWSVLANINASGSKASSLIQAALGGRYSGGDWDASLQLGSDSTCLDEHLSTIYNLQGKLNWQASTHLQLDFKKALTGSLGLFPEELEAFAAGLVGKLPFSFTYTHGGKHYAEQVVTRLVLPVEGEFKRGAISGTSQYLYKDGFQDLPRRVYSLAGDLNFNFPSSTYLRARASFSASSFAAASTNTYLLHMDTGSSLGEKTVLDYQLRLSGGNTKGGRETMEDKNTWGQTFTLAIPFTEKINTALVYRQAKNRRWRSDRGLATSTERGWQASIMGQTDSIEGILTYDCSSTVTESETGIQRADLQKIDLGLSWQKGGLVVEGAFAFAIHDQWRRRVQAQITPAYRLSENAQFWLGYRYITSRNLKSRDDQYNVHLVKTGITFEL